MHTRHPEGEEHPERPEPTERPERAHHSEHEPPGLDRPPAAHREPWEVGQLVRAAVAGRTDVLGRSGVGALQRSVGNGAVGAVLQRGAAPGAAEAEEAAEERSSVHDVLSSGGGAPLDGDTRRDMEARLGADFSDVRVHTDSAAHESAREVGARAYTVGNDVVFQRDAYAPDSDDGRRTLAHELTHVIQQRSGPVDGEPAAGGIRVSDPSDRFEREAVANADRALAGPAPDTAPAAPPVQRQEEDEDEEPADVQDVQGDFGDGGAAQREAASEEEDDEAGTG